MKKCPYECDNDKCEVEKPEWAEKKELCPYCRPDFPEVGYYLCDGEYIIKEVK
jgi:hypothetical protein